jgi:hypothetical protein
MQPAAKISDSVKTLIPEGIQEIWKGAAAPAPGYADDGFTPFLSLARTL